MNEVWRVDVFNIDARSCGSGCSCDASAVSKHGNCDRVSGFHIKKGISGEVTLDNLNVASIGRWPGPISANHGMVAYYIDVRATPTQFDALARIVMGRVGGQFELWNRSVEERLEPAGAVVSIIINGPRSGLKIETFAEVRLKPRVAEERPYEGGVESRTKSAGSDKVSAERLRADFNDFRFEYSGTYASFQETTWCGP